ncbi:hypothetical protein [Paenibacillus mendelii]|uniref:WYL domain-containing protein n=1 Tax=Paenibacillus mendelii TaxID=206163 RepID=A0ABV6JH80_9BACL|nr:hypothetical protein [Paenibacillus mendelii]MCQ6558137.1 hypothetical protein [Paenibacillus mendelii]
MSVEKYIGRIIRIVYMDRHSRISERIIQIRAVRDGQIKAYCMTSRGPRIFHVDNVLAYEVVRHHAI